MEALANINQFGICELKEDELVEVDGGLVITTGAIIGGALFLIGVGIGIAWAFGFVRSTFSTG